MNDKSYDQYSVTIDSAPMGPRSEVPPSVTPRVHSTIGQQSNRAAMEANRAAFGYTKVALLFFVSLLVTWVCFSRIQLHRTRLSNYIPPAHEESQVPSSINRVYSLVHPSLISVPFTYASGIVLPLMGFWNSVIYVTTSWAAVRMLFSGKLNEKGTGSVKRGCSVGCSGRPSLGARRWTGNESDSTKALAVGQGSGYDQV